MIKNHTSQYTNRNPVIRENSLVLCVTKTASFALVITAINRSFGPIIFPWVLKSARIKPYSSAQRSSKGRLLNGAKKRLSNCRFASTFLLCRAPKSSSALTMLHQAISSGEELRKCFSICEWWLFNR